VDPPAANPGAFIIKVEAPPTAWSAEANAPLTPKSMERREESTSFALLFALSASFPPLLAELRVRPETAGEAAGFCCW